MILAGSIVPSWHNILFEQPMSKQPNTSPLSEARPASTRYGTRLRVDGTNPKMSTCYTDTQEPLITGAKQRRSDAKKHLLHQVSEMQKKVGPKNDGGTSEVFFTTEDGQGIYIHLLGIVQSTLRPMTAM